MNLQESIRRILREETKLPLFIIRRFSEEDIDELISNVKFSIPLYGDDKNINDVIDDEVREFMMDKSDFGHHGTLRNDLTGNEYFVQLDKFEEPLRDYVRSVILNTNLQESIRRILREELKYKTLFRRLDRPDELGITFIDHMKRLSPCKYELKYEIDPDEELFYDAAQSTTSIIIGYLSAFKFITTKDRIEESDVVVKLRRDIYDFLYENYLDVAKEYYKNNVTKCR